MTMSKYATPPPSLSRLPVSMRSTTVPQHEAALPVDATDPLPALRAALGLLGQEALHPDKLATLLSRAIRDFDSSRIPRATNLRLPFAAVREETC